ncbi:MAG: hypothetical protein ACXABO_12405 [Promethearchaeota archaeon]|jgi:hypothetical protein
MMNKELLKEFLDLPNRDRLFGKILNKLRNYCSDENVSYYEFESFEGKIPIIIIDRLQSFDDIKYVKMYIGAQHNEYTGLLGILEFLRRVEESIISLDNIALKHQIIIFAPLMNPYGFLNPSKENKSGYYLRNGTNLNRYWEKTFTPQDLKREEDLNHYNIPEHAKIVYKLLAKYWKKEDIKIYTLDFHETSLLKKFSANLITNIKRDSISYKFSHWLEEGIITNIIKLYNLQYSKKPLFYRCKSNINYTHINLTTKQLDIVYEKLQDYMIKNKGKMPFYYCYSNRSKIFCESLAKNVYNSLKDVLWETYLPAFNHNFIDHGCLVNMNNKITRKGVYSMELESQKHFFNIFDEINKSKSDKNYFREKIKLIDIGVRLVVESITEMIGLF